MRKLTLIMLCMAFCGAANADPMPPFADVPTGWFTDRYDPYVFANIGAYMGRTDVLAIGINADEDGLTSRPPAYQNTFYNTQGRQHLVTAEPGAILAADLFIPIAWSDETNGTVRSDMWAVMTDGSAVSDYPIIGFTNYGGVARHRLWDDDHWVDLEAPVIYDAWNAYQIEFTGTGYTYRVNGAEVFTDTTANGSSAFQATIMQAYNFAGDPSLGAVNAVSYTAYWDNGTVPEPSSLLLLASALAAVAVLRRKRQHQL